ncbi:MAG: hypothetical protein RIQ79_1158, partial [Verrucomicrobiota bacterium]
MNLHVVKTAKQSTAWEWAFLGLMAGVSILLTLLQFHWTGELARAELERRRADYGERATPMAASFDHELNERCRLLCGRAGAADWRTAWGDVATGGGWFARVAMVEKRRGEPVLSILSSTGQWAEADWPEGWTDLRGNLSTLTRRGAGANWKPFRDPKGLLLEFPVHGAESTPGNDGPPGDSGPPGAGGPLGNGGPPGERWLVVELAADAVRETWFRPAVERAFGAAPEASATVVVRAGETVVFSSIQPAPKADPATPPLAFHHQGRGTLTSGPGNATTEAIWRLEVHPIAGALDRLVASARRRNLVGAILLNSLLLAAGVVLVLQARRSRRLAEARMNFVANVTHELRTPLTVIRGAAHNIRRGIVQDPARVEHYARLIDRHADQLAQMVEQVLEYARIGRMDGSAGDAAPLASENLLREAITASGPDAEVAHCVIEAEIPDALPEVRGDAAALRRLFQNLLVNAAKHGGSGGWIGVTARAMGSGARQSLEVRIMDRGPGVPAAEREE